MFQFASREAREAAGAVPQAVPMNIVQIEKAQEHVRAPLNVVGKNNMTVTLECPIDFTDQFDRNLLVSVAMRISHVGSFINQHVIENIAVTVRDVLQFLAEVREILHVIAIDLRIVGFVRRNIAVMR